MVKLLDKIINILVGLVVYLLSYQFITPDLFLDTLQPNNGMDDNLNFQSKLSGASQNNPNQHKIHNKNHKESQISKYFSKLQEKLLQKSNRYANLIGKTYTKANQKYTDTQRSQSPQKHKHFETQTTIYGEKQSTGGNQNKSQYDLSLKQSNKNLHKKLNLPGRNLQNDKQPNQYCSPLLRNPQKTTQNIIYQKAYQSKRQVQSEQLIKDPPAHYDRKNAYQKNNNVIIFNEESVFNKKQESKQRQAPKQTQVQTQVQKQIKDKSKDQYIAFKSQLKFLLDSCRQKIKKNSNIDVQLHRTAAYNLTFQNKSPSILEDSPEKSKNRTSNGLKAKAIQLYNNEKNKNENVQNNLDYIQVSTRGSSSKIIKNNPKNPHKTQLIRQEKQLERLSGKIKKAKEQFTSNKELTLSNIKDSEGTFTEKSSNQKIKLSLDDFDILGEMGEGKVGKVYLVRHKKTRMLMALKTISREIINEHLEIQLTREIKIQSFLEHPNIVQLYAYFSDQENFYLVLELCFSGNLYTHLRREKVLPEKEIKNIIRQVCHALEYMHDNDIIHRDLKPENLLMHGNVIKICDFGWAVHSPILRGTLCGTPVYASPQLVEKKSYSNKIDIWNVGVLTYELLCGRVPFEIRSQQDLIKVVEQQVFFPNFFPISDACRQFILCCLNKSPEKRFDIVKLLSHPFLAE